MRSTNGALMSSKPPSVQPGGHKVNSWHHNMSRVRACGDVGNNVLVSEPAKAVVTSPSVGMDLCSRHHVCRHESVKTGRGDVRNNGHSDSAGPTTSDFRAYGHNRFSFRTTPPDLFANTSEISFVDFNTAGQLLSTRAHHGPAQFMKPTPCRMVTTQPQNPLHTKRAGTVLLTRDEPYRQNPCTKGFVRSVKQSPGSNRSLPLTLSTKIKLPPHQP